MSIFKPKKDITTIADMGSISLALERVSGEENNRYTMAGWQGRRILRRASKELFYERESMMSSAIDKTASKLFFNWMEMASPKKGEHMDETVQDNLVQFHRDIQLPSMLEQNAKDAQVYGNGWMEMIPDKGEDRPDVPLDPSQGLYKLETVDPMFMLDKTQRINPREFYFLERRPDGEVIKHHNSRMIHVPWYKLGTAVFGIGCFDKCFRSMIAKLNMDWAVGEILFRFGKPFLVLKTTGAQEKEIKQAYRALQQLNPRTGFAGTERHEFDILNPEVIDPDNFAKFYHMNLASAVGMSYLVFVGLQHGAVTGSETDRADWYDHLAGIQKTKYNPVIHAINNQYLNGNWMDKIYWNEIYVNEKAKAEIFKIYNEGLKTMLEAGYVLDIEARQIARDLGIGVPEDDSEFEAEKEDEPEYPEPLDFPIEPKE